MSVEIAAMAGPVRRHRFSVEDYHRMGELGILCEDDRVELLHGEGVEVSDTSQVVDREVKAPLYGRSGIPEYWLVDLAKDRIEVYREPSKEGYRRTETVDREGALCPVAFPEFALRVDDILP